MSPTKGKDNSLQNIVNRKTKKNKNRIINRKRGIKIKLILSYKKKGNFKIIKYII
jgi:hypothetical protein